MFLAWLDSYLMVLEWLDGHLLVLAWLDGYLLVGWFWHGGHLMVGWSWHGWSSRGWVVLACTAGRTVADICGHRL